MLTNAALAGYRAILRLYPRRFRDQFEDDMLRDFIDTSVNAPLSAGWAPRFAQTRHAYADAVVSLVREWGRERTTMIGAISVVATAVLFIVPFLPPLPNIKRPPARPLSLDELWVVLLILGLLALVALIIVLGSRMFAGRAIFSSKSFCVALILGLACTSTSTAQTATATSGFVDVDGGRVYYDAAGQGRALILIHDGVLHREVWDAQLSELAKQFRVVRWDRRGFGRSSSATAPYSDLDDLAAVIRALKLESPVLVGSSVGSFIAVQFALDHPSMVSGLVLAGPTISGLMPSEHFIMRGNRGQPPPQAPFEARVEYWTAKDPWILAPENKAARERMRRLLLANPAGPANGRQFARFAPQPALPRLSEIKVPTLIVAGEYDMPDVHAWAGAIQAGIAGSRRVVLANSGHLPQFETPAAFNAELLKLVQSLK